MSLKIQLSKHYTYKIFIIYNVLILCELGIQYSRNKLKCELSYVYITKFYFL